jgi:hypothetical protein
MFGRNGVRCGAPAASRVVIRRACLSFLLMEEAHMNMFTLFILAAVLAAVVSLISGISSMAVGHDVGHRSSAQWMTLRVVFQGAALVLILLALLGPH